MLSIYLIADIIAGDKVSLSNIMHNAYNECGCDMIDCKIYGELGDLSIYNLYR